MHGAGHVRTQKAITFFGAGDSELGAYSIFCPVCGWGDGGGLEKAKVEELQKLYVETVKA